MKFILICGGVISGVGKGVVASSLGRILKEGGLGVTIIKIDPYLNFDAGTLGPRDHGEVFVLDDGTETDLDLGNYERFLGVNLTKLNSITSGRMYQEVIARERRGEYLGKTVQVVPHVTEHIKASIREAASAPIDGSTTPPDVCIIELGGIVGDIESTTFIEALRQLMQEVKRARCLTIAVDYAIELNGEHKTKPIQVSSKRAREQGIGYDVVICRSVSKIQEEALGKVALFTGAEKIVELPDCNVLNVPNRLREEGMLEYLVERLSLTIGERKEGYFNHLIAPKQRACSIAIVGKYSNHEDAYLSIKESLKFAGATDKMSIEAKTTYFDTSLFSDSANLAKLQDFDGIIIPGGFGRRGVEEMIKVAEYARKNQVPLMGICLGLQVMVIEYARNVLGLAKATSEELVKKEDIHAIIDDKINHENAPEESGEDFFIIAKHSNTIRIGGQATYTLPGTQLARIYGVPEGAQISERFRHRYGVIESVAYDLEAAGFKVGIQDGKYIDGMELASHPFYIGVQFHPEFMSKPSEPRPIFTAFLQACTAGSKPKTH
ncbi:CTP synthase [Nematocida displodere]|uniref:CTP synthase n=1 Tax=Nematocida displodere TaxID=1805483 RepID=A0A177EIH7_9MICR|nr:CTP synthase [Nematocida displodere]